MIEASVKWFYSPDFDYCDLENTFDLFQVTIEIQRYDSCYCDFR
jgi:hypothetical protein